MNNTISDFYVDDILIMHIKHKELAFILKTSVPRLPIYTLQEFFMRKHHKIYKTKARLAICHFLLRNY